MQYRTFKEWAKRGKVVKKGEKSSARTTEGIHLFSSSQVKDVTKGSTIPSEPYYENFGLKREYLNGSDYGWDSLDYDPFKS